MVLVDVSGFQKWPISLFNGLPRLFVTLTETDFKGKMMRLRNAGRVSLMFKIVL